MNEIFFVIEKNDRKDLINLCLPEHILNHCKKKDEESIFTSLLSYSILEKLLSVFHLDIEKLHFSDNGKPLLDGCYVSISHSNDFIIVSFAKINHGVDLQYHQLKVDKDKIMRRYFNKNLDEYLMKDEKEKINYFYRLWTLRESIIKKDDLILFDEVDDTNLFTFTTILNLNKGKYSLSFASDFPFVVKEMHF